jgi:hypothetical protein
MGLADSLNNAKQPPAANASPIQRGSSRMQLESRAPKIVPASKKRKGEQEHTKRVAIVGPAGTGKTHSIFSLIKHLATIDHLNPEEIRVEMLDLDGGMSELTDQRLIPDEYLDCIYVATCRDFEELVDATKAAYQRLDEHKKKFGGIGDWLVVDNVEKSWDYVQNDYCLAVYGMPLMERKKQVRESQVEARKLGGKGESVFDKNLDWGTIKPMYADWIKSMEVCDHNILLLSPWKMQEIKDKAGNVVEMHEKFGADGNSLIVSYIIKLHFDNNKNRRATFLKSRATNLLPRDLIYSNWTDLFKELDRIAAAELKEREASMKREVYGRPTDIPRVALNSDEEAFKEKKVEEIMSAAVSQSASSNDVGATDAEW